jgi:hypothetical protein
VAEIDDSSSSFAGSSHEGDEDHGDDDGDLDAKIRWFFLTIEKDAEEGKEAEKPIEEKLYFCQNPSESDN